jgi:flagellar basal-body rod protein FlgB
MDAEMRIDNVLDLAARQASWLLTRQSLVAQNVANVNTPGYKAVDLKPFDGALQAASLQLVKTSPNHMSIEESAADAATPEDASPQKNETYLSGNDVSLEREMLKGGEINRLYSLNAAVTKAFNGMIVQTAKG